MGNIEWIATLLYKKIEGDIDNPSTLVLQAERLFLMDIGTAGHTDAILDAEEICLMWDKIPDMFDLKQGLIHTHHSMGAFFSGEDWSELNDNTPLHNYYLSLIVNNNGPYVAKVAYVAEVENQFKFKNSRDESVTNKTTKKVMVVMDMDIYLENEEIDQEFDERYNYIRDKVNKAKVANTTYISHPNRPAKNYQDGYDDDVLYGHGEVYTPGTGGGHWVGQTWVSDKHALGGEAPVQGELGLVEANTKGSFRKNNEGHSINALTTWEGREVCLRWLNLGLEVETFTEPIMEFRTILEGLRFYTNMFNKPSGPNFLYFMNCMQKALVEATEEYAPSLVAKVIQEILAMYLGDKEVKNMAREFSTVAKAHPVFIKLMRVNMKANERNT